MTLDELKQLKIGDVVKLNSAGGPEITVSEIEASFVSGDFWNEAKTKFESITFDYAQLVKVNKE